MAKVGDETIRNFGIGSSVDPLLGLVVDSYKIESQIGSGAMGIVYRGVHTVIGKTAAIKVLKPDYADDPEMVQRLIREARSVNAIRHPAIVDIFGFGSLPRSGQPYIVMDLLEGQPLDQFIAEYGPVPPKDALPLLDELLGALDAAHQVGVIHRDLKPGNVFVENKPDAKRAIKVIDFGLARQADRAGGSVRPTNPGTLLGTPAFMAPEQVLGTKVLPATDLYAVGGIAYQMLTNHLPHEAPSAIEVLSQKMQHDPIRPRQWQPALSEELDAWVMKLLSREVEDRHATAAEARKALRKLAPRHGPARSTTGGGVVPRRNWGDAKTVLTESAAAAKELEESTSEHPSPWVKPGGEAGERTSAPTETLELPSPSTQKDVPVTPEATAAEISPRDEAAAAAPAATASVVSAPAAPAASSRGSLYAALGVALAALIAGLVWLLVQTW